MRVCCLDEPGLWAEEVARQGVTVAALGRQSGFRPGLGGQVARHAREHEANVIHAHHYSPFVYSCLARARGTRAGIVFTEHGRLSDAPPSAKRRIANRVLSRMPRRVFAVSRDLKAHMTGEGFRDDAIDVIYNGIDVGPRPDAGARARAREWMGVGDDVLVVATIARLDPVKDLGTLIAACSQISTAVPILLLVIGDGPERDHLQQIALAAQPAIAVRFAGHRDDARQWLAGSDVYVNCSVSEGVSLTILEAMAAGLPVVATRVGGTPEVIDETCGRFIPSRNPAALAGAILELSGQPELRRRLGDGGRARVEERFTLERMIREYRDVYHEVA